jgi:TolB-like protein
MKKNRAALLAVVALLLAPVAAGAAEDKDAQDINDYITKIAQGVAGYVDRAKATEIAVAPYKNAADAADYPLSQVLTGQLLQELRDGKRGNLVINADGNAPLRVTGTWRVTDGKVEVSTRIVVMPSGVVDYTYTGNIPLNKVPKVYLTSDKPEQKPKPIDRGTRVAILDFAGVGTLPNLAYLGRSIPETITTTFASQSDMLLIERLQLDKVLAELRLSETRYVDPDSAIQIGKLLGATYVVIGSYQSLGNKVRLMARRVKVETGEIFEAARVIGTADNIFTLEEELANALLADIQRYR